MALLTLQSFQKFAVCCICSRPLLAQRGSPAMSAFAPLLGAERTRGAVEAARPDGRGPSRKRRVGALGFALHHAQAPALLNHSRPLPQGDGDAGPAFAGGAAGGECNLIVLNTGNMLNDAFAVRRPGIDAEGEMGS